MADNTQDQKDYKDYLDYQHYMRASAQAANPQTSPDSADKAATQKHPAAVSSQADSPLKSFLSKALQPELVDPRLKAPAYMPVIAGSIPAPQALVSTLVRRTGLNGLMGAAQGVLQPPSEDQTRLGNAVKGAGIGVGLGLGAEAIGGLYGGLRSMYRAGKDAKNPAGLQDEALSAIGDATDKLKSGQSENVQHQLADKTIKIDTTRIRGINPEIDSLLSSHSSKSSPYGDIPSELEVPAQDANKIRSLLDQEMTYKKLGPYAQNAETAARDAQIKPLADQLRQQVHSLSPELSNTFDQWSEDLNAARNLDKRAETAPMTVLSSPSFDRRALLQKVDQEAGTGLQDLGKRIENAKNLSNAVHQARPLKAAAALGKAGVAGLKEGASESPETPALLQGLFYNQR